MISKSLLNNDAPLSLGTLGQDEDTTKHKLWHKAPPTMDNWLSYKGLTQDSHAYLKLIDGTFAEIMAVEGIGLSQLPDSQVSSVTEGFTNFWRHYLEDVTIVTTPFPATTTTQQLYWFKKMETAASAARQVTDERQKRVWLARQRYSADRIKTAKAVEEQLQNQEYMMVFFGPSINELQNLVDTAKQFAGTYLQLTTMTPKRKELMVFRINNMNVKV